MKIILLLVYVFFNLTSYGQKFVVTPDGLRNADDTEKTFISVDVDSMTAKQLYDNALKFIIENHKDPSEVIKGQIEPEYLKYDSYVPDFLIYDNNDVKIPIRASYTTELRFKDGKFRFEIVSLEMKGKSKKYKVLFTGGLTEGYIIYKRNGVLFKEDTKTDIENYFNEILKTLTNYILRGTGKGDW